MNYAAMNVLVHVFWQIYVCIYVGNIPRSRISGLWGMQRLSLSIYYQTVFQSGCTPAIDLLTLTIPCLKTHQGLINLLRITAKVLTVAYKILYNLVFLLIFEHGTHLPQGLCTSCSLHLLCSSHISAWPASLLNYAVTLHVTCRCKKLRETNFVLNLPSYTSLFLYFTLFFFLSLATWHMYL